MIVALEGLSNGLRPRLGADFPIFSAPIPLLLLILFSLLKRIFPPFDYYFFSDLFLFPLLSLAATAVADFFWAA